MPVSVLKYYRTPAFVGPRTLAFAISYSGDTEETVEMARGALDAGARLMTVTCGGALGELARERGALNLPCTPGIAMPRTALGAMLAPVLSVFFRMGLMPEAHASLVKAQEQLARRREQCKPEVEGTKNPARELARKIGRTIPLVHGAGGLGAVAAMRWKQSVNENAKAPAFWNVYPELDHNEICAWGQHGDMTRQVLTLVSLRHGMEHARLEQRVTITNEMIREAFVQVLDVRAEGRGAPRAAPRPHLPRRLDERVPGARQRRRPGPHRRDRSAQGRARRQLSAPEAEQVGPRGYTDRLVGLVLELSSGDPGRLHVIAVLASARRPTTGVQP